MYNTGVVHETGNVEKLSEIIIIINLCAPLASMLFTVSIIFILAFFLVYIRYSCHSLCSNHSRFKFKIKYIIDGGRAGMVHMTFYDNDKCIMFHIYLSTIVLFNFIFMKNILCVQK